jgi:ABC-2 type transport system permease protein
MRNILLIAKREYLERVRQRSFVIMTVLIPLLMFAAVGGPALLMTRTGNETKRMVVVSPDRDTAEMIRSRIEQREDEKKSDTQTSTKRSLPPLHFSVEIDTVATDAERAALTAKVNQKELDGFLWATPDAIAAKKLDFVTRDTSSFINNGLLGQAVSNALHRASLKSKGFNQSEIDAALEPVDVEAVSPLGKNVPNPEVMFFAWSWFSTYQCFCMGLT